MKIAFFDTHEFEKEYWQKANSEFAFDLQFLEPRLTFQTAGLAADMDVVCSFVNDRIDAETVKKLKDSGIRLIALRSAGYNQVDLNACNTLGVPVVRVPEYSPYAVAEHALCLILSLNRKIHRAHARVREANFSLNGLVGFDIHGKTVGILGTGKIGSVMCQLMAGFGCQILAYDVKPNANLVDRLSVKYTSLDEIYRQSDIVSLHLPLTPDTRHILNGTTIAKMKPGVMIINTGRGALIDTTALISALKSGQIGYAGLDVYEEEEGIFFNDLSDQVLRDDALARLLTFPNVLITSHQAFLTREALMNIARTTLENIQAFARGDKLGNQVFSASNASPTAR
jgi:D-lactate dehydrogenase